MFVPVIACDPHMKHVKLYFLLKNILKKLLKIEAEHLYLQYDWRCTYFAGL